MKKFFTIMVMVIAMTFGSVGQAFANDIYEGLDGETVEKFERLLDGAEDVYNYHPESSWILISQRIVKYTFANNNGTFEDYGWEICVYDTGTNSYISSTAYLGTGEFLDGYLDAVESLLSEI